MHAVVAEGLAIVCASAKPIPLPVSSKFKDAAWVKPGDQQDAGKDYLTSDHLQSATGGLS